MTQALFNQTSPFGTILVNFTNNVTGSFFLTLLIIVLFFIALFALMRVPIEWTAVFILPLLLTILAYSSDFLAVVGTILIYMGIIFARLFFLR